jgi:hypothetical protein
MQQAIDLFTRFVEAAELQAKNTGRLADETAEHNQLQKTIISLRQKLIAEETEERTSAAAAETGIVETPAATPPAGKVRVAVKPKAAAPAAETPAAEKEDTSIKDAVPYEEVVEALKRAKDRAGEERGEVTKAWQARITELGVDLAKRETARSLHPSKYAELVEFLDGLFAE